MNRTKNAKRNIVFTFLNKLVTLFYPFILRTIVIHEIGAEFLGLNSLYASILQVLNLTELGFSSVIVFCMYKPIAENDSELLCALLNLFRKVYFIIGIVVLTLGLLILPFLPFLINGDAPEGVNIYIIYCIFLFNSCISYFLFAYKGSLLNAYQRVDIVSNISTVVFLLSYTVQLFVVIITKNFYLYASCSILSTILINVLTAYITRKKYPNLVCRGNVPIELKREIKEKLKGLIISKLTGISRNAFDSIFLSAFLGLIQTAIYNNYYYIMNAVSGFIIIIYSSIIAGVGNSVVTETEDKNYSDLNKFNFLYMWISGWCTVCLLCLYQPFTKLFFGEELLFPTHTVVLFCLYFYQLRTGDILSVYSDANGLWWKTRYASIVEFFGNIILNFTLGKYFGADGIVFATLFVLFITSFFLGSKINIKYSFPTKKYSEYIKSHIFYFFVTLFVGFITFVCLYNLFIINELITFFVKLILCLILPNFIYILFYCKTKRFQVAKSWLISIMRSKNR